MTAPYRDHLAAIRAALNVDARSLYKPASWQHQAMIGYREELPPAPGDLSKLERFQQDCMTYAFLNQRMPPVQWACIIVRHALPVKDRATNPAEFDRLKWAVLAVMDGLEWGDREFMVWAIKRWGCKLQKAEDGWKRWHGTDVPQRTREYHYNRTCRFLDQRLKLSEENAERLLSDGGLIERVAA